MCFSNDVMQDVYSNSRNKLYKCNQINAFCSCLLCRKFHYKVNQTLPGRLVLRLKVFALPWFFVFFLAVFKSLVIFGVLSVSVGLLFSIFLTVGVDILTDCRKVSFLARRFLVDSRSYGSKISSGVGRTSSTISSVILFQHSEPENSPV